MKTKIYTVLPAVFLDIILAAASSPFGFAQGQNTPDQSMPGMQTPATAPLPQEKNSSQQSGVTLAELEQMDLSSNPTLAQAAAKIRAVTARKLQSGLYPNPTDRKSTRLNSSHRH